MIIISSGLFFALVAAGFSLDRITIVLGALSVGVGLGLQGLVGNLVSGLVIVFEKPINVGDVIEIGGQSGGVKSIGFRSSIISVWAGADIVIPNGDLLNAHLVNWTLSGGKRRVEIIVGVSYGTDLERVREILHAMLDENERVLKYPKPLVMLGEFSKNSINVKVYFWVTDFRAGFYVKSEVIGLIDKVFKENEIFISLPQ